jgi:hypothetical protein
MERAINMQNLGDFMPSQGKDVNLLIQEVALMKLLVKERFHPLDLLRELISNSGAREVETKVIRIKYTVDEEGHIFEVIDDGCGMDFTGNKEDPGRLDKFLGLGLSTIVGIRSDEFSWKGLGSKLAYQSQKIVIDTWCGRGDAIRVEINDPWGSINRGTIPKPKKFTYEPEADRIRGTSIKVFGHPPHKKEKPFTLEEIKKFLLHRTFIGFTRNREIEPKISLSVLGHTEEINFGFPELKVKGSDGTRLVNEHNTAKINGTNKSITVHMKGFYTWDDKDCGLDKNQLNTGLVLSVKGIPYFNLDMEEYGSRNLKLGRPGVDKCCLIVECDQIQEEMNISRSRLVDSETTDLFKKAVREIFEKIESSQEYLKFRRIQEDRRTVVSAEALGIKKQELESEEQSCVVYQKSESEKPIYLSREPECESDVLCILWKLEVLNALPFKTFMTLGYVGSGKKGGPDLLVHFQEDEQSDQERYTPIEVENKFYNYIPHGHKPAQFPKVICWELGKTTKIPINKTDKRYKFTAVKDGVQIHIFSLRLMENLKIVSKRDLGKY